MTWDQKTGWERNQGKFHRSCFKGHQFFSKWSERKTLFYGEGRVGRRDERCEVF